MAIEFLSVDVLERWVSEPRISLSVLRFGFDAGCVSAQQVVEVELSRYKPGEKIAADEELLAFLLSDELDVVVQILSRNERNEPESSLLWFYSAGEELRSMWDRRLAPEEDLYEILEALGLDERYRRLVYFQPVSIFKGKRRLSDLKNILEVELDDLRGRLLSLKEAGNCHDE